MIYSANKGTVDNPEWKLFYKTCIICDVPDWSGFEQLTDTSNDMYSDLINYDNKLYHFYTECKKVSWPESIWRDVDNCYILYRAYDGNWYRKCGFGGGKIPNLFAYPSLAVNLGNLHICHQKYDIDWKIICRKV